ncbi:class I tRNA ligase family protein, partial [bacterium]|nr:class I tRNA ligase family protein [bacterium]
NEFCDWGIELSKVSKESVAELGAIFKESMKLLHPFMPFMTEYLYHSLSGTSLEAGSSIMIEQYPLKGGRDLEIEKQFAIIMDAVIAVRRAKTLVDMGNQKIAEAYVKTDVDAKELMGPFIARLAKVEELKFTDTKIDNAVSDISEYVEVYIPTGSIDLEPIINRLTKQKEKLDIEINKLSGMLSNERFVANAPESVIAQNRETLADAQTKQQKIIDQLDSLQG